tara:strand:- start:2 stop:457 length:456 start_codon:yes stop_codon:yes gene_type:complete
MLREQISAALKDSIKNKNACATATLRLISAAIKDRDIAARDKGNQDGISNDEILSLLQSMIKQRNESAKAYEDGNRQDLADREREEIVVIQGFLPQQMSEDEIADAVTTVIQTTGADCIKDMGKCMGELKKQFAGRMDFTKASALVKEKLC